MSTTYALIISAFILSAAILFVNDKVVLAVLAASIAAAVAFGLIRLLRRMDKYERMF